MAHFALLLHLWSISTRRIMRQLIRQQSVFTPDLSKHSGTSSEVGSGRRPRRRASESDQWQCTGIPTCRNGADNGIQHFQIGHVDLLDFFQSLGMLVNSWLNEIYTFAKLMLVTQATNTTSEGFFSTLSESRLTCVQPREKPGSTSSYFFMYTKNWQMASDIVEVANVFVGDTQQGKST